MKFVLLLLLSLSAFGSEGRPDGLVNFKNEGCICNDGRSISMGFRCTKMCEETSTQGRDIFYAQFNVKENEFIKDIFEWCRHVLEEDVSLPTCILNAKDKDGRENNFQLISVSENSIAVDVSTLADDEIYVVKLFEQSSQTSSDFIQTLKFPKK